ncbi:cytochrome c oxidase subunit 3 family protein [Stigmatella aurantiaca]|uniref:Cytochrome c oxidase, subunit III n=1 Tax=Stigmatella aurantiaca (strain DW4/3-1) TaxID=378806 RepID=Q08R75_STIAD|nr:cytochrome c oxidase subunit 3 family protein [Stigmatella aurantiaca]ADO74538.1 Cytochrome c oxidase, subunit III [Stigmatella aurantiaca DW4/3-1]EAU62969.1 cytochrome oxidase subunit III [Stigmatella aurantiaca DW4/3-1]
MSSAPAAHGAAPAPKFAEHFASLEVQNHAARLGMWLFLSTEILLFAGLFACYACYRFLYPEAFAEASRHLDLTLGTVNTVVLITSSLTAALAVHYAKEGKNNMVALMVALTLLMALGFLVIKGFEYSHKFHEGTLPGKHYSYQGLQLPGAPMYFTIYFLSTGLHAFHVTIGMGVLAWMGIRAITQKNFGPNNYTGVELASMYWHLVDLVWIFLFPMLYLV